MDESKERNYKFRTTTVRAELQIPLDDITNSARRLRLPRQKKINIFLFLKIITNFAAKFFRNVVLKIYLPMDICKN